MIQEDLDFEDSFKFLTVDGDPINLKQEEKFTSDDCIEKFEDNKYLIKLSF